MLVYWRAGNLSNTQKLPFSLMTDFYTAFTLCFETTPQLFKQKRSTTLMGNVLNVNLKLHNSEIEGYILQKCKNVI